MAQFNKAGGGGGSGDTIGRRELAAQLAARTTGVTETQVYTLLGELGNAIADNLRAGRRVNITGFGSWETRDRQARMGHNPQTRQVIQIPATRVPAFSAGANLRSAVSGNYKKARGGGGGGGGTKASTAPVSSTTNTATTGRRGRGGGGRGGGSGGAAGG